MLSSIFFGLVWEVVSWENEGWTSTKNKAKEKRVVRIFQFEKERMVKNKHKNEREGFDSVQLDLFKEAAGRNQGDSIFLIRFKDGILDQICA